MANDLIARLRAFEGSDDLDNGDFSVCIEAAERIDALEAVLRECARDLSGELDVRYGGRASFAIEERRFQRDMEPVRKARQLLGGLYPPSQKHVVAIKRSG
jgi:hypothetical protein